MCEAVSVSEMQCCACVMKWVRCVTTPPRSVLQWTQLVQGTGDALTVLWCCGTSLVEFSQCEHMSHATQLQCRSCSGQKKASGYPWAGHKPDCRGMHDRQSQVNQALGLLPSTNEGPDCDLAPAVTPPAHQTPPICSHPQDQSLQHPPSSPAFESSDTFRLFGQGKHASCMSACAAANAATSSLVKQLSFTRWMPLNALRKLAASSTIPAAVLALSCSTKYGSPCNLARCIKVHGHKQGKTTYTPKRAKPKAGSVCTASTKAISSAGVSTINSRRVRRVRADRPFTTAERPRGVSSLQGRSWAGPFLPRVLPQPRAVATWCSAVSWHGTRLLRANSAAQHWSGREVQQREGCHKYP